MINGVHKKTDFFSCQGYLKKWQKGDSFRYIVTPFMVIVLKCHQYVLKICVNNKQRLISEAIHSPLTFSSSQFEHCMICYTMSLGYVLQLMGKLWKEGTMAMLTATLALA